MRFNFFYHFRLALGIEMAIANIPSFSMLIIFLLFKSE